MGTYFLLSAEYPKKSRNLLFIWKYIQLVHKLTRYLLFRYQAREFICEVQLLSDKMNYLIWILFIITNNFCFCVDLEVTDIAKRVASRAKNAIDWSLESGGIHYKNFGTWNYEGAMVYRGLWEIQSALADELDFDIEPFLHDHLNFYQVSKIN